LILPGKTATKLAQAIKDLRLDPEMVPPQIV
jgi:hypothetical protein